MAEKAQWQRRTDQWQATRQRVPSSIAAEDVDATARSIAKHDRKLRRLTQVAQHARDVAIEQWFVDTGWSHVFGIPRRNHVTGEIEGGGHPN